MFTNKKNRMIQFKTLLIALTLTLTGFGQTKSIALKRHAGSKTLTGNNWKMDPSNLGVAPEKWIRNSELKKVVFIDDSTQAMVTEESCKNLYSYKQRETQEWRAGTDTVKHHPVFSAQISVDSMRTILKSNYYFANDMADVEFIGFEKEKDDKKKKTHNNGTSKQKLNPGKQTTKWSAYEKFTLLTLLFASSIGIGVLKLK